MPFQMVVSLWFVRRHIAFHWSEVWVALWRSAVATVTSAAGPICVVALSDTGIDLSMAATVMAILLATVGWLAGVVMTQHPVLLELRKAAGAIVESAFGRSLGARLPRPRPAGGAIE